ncbi:putative plant lipid transfer protein/Par allergen [Helianthus annuus]|uniref:Plant lipid transfer protein/Par allergen n=1 Tax=Helianthus annuus TaxID=4232 RepID=A0A251V2F5_HELAN|nr:non-specific lipid-transfer protein C6 isoform X1 [Helianthus annuus]KAF5811219.1 putative plant lipid transfer protein/Par allergen [Helianthus annuus]
MALKGEQVMGAVLVLMVMVLGGAQAQSSTCINALMGLSPCLNFVSGNTSTPSPACCSQLSSVVQSQPRCLCSLLNGNLPNIGVTINQTLAVTLPGACRVQTPPISLCNGVANGPAGAPASAPTIAPTGSTDSPTDPSEGTPEVQAPTAPLTPTTPSGSGSGSKATPSTNNKASHGSKFGAPTYLLLLVVFFGMKL